MPEHGIKIASLYAWTASDQTGNEGVICDQHLQPMVGANRDQIAALRPDAERFRAASGWAVHLKMFGAGVIIDTLP